MGVEGLWNLVEEASETVSLRTLTIQEGFEGSRPERLYFVGVDASIWMQTMIHKFRAGHAQSGENPELLHLLRRLAMLAERPIHAIFVADGVERPAVKRLKEVKKTPVWLTDAFRDLVEAFGFVWLQAAGEAEAELAKMNRLGYIDAVMTDDSDTLVFGAPVIIRNPSFKRTGSDVVQVYRQSKVHQKTGLALDDLFLYSLLVGCDYDQHGLRGCGSGIAKGVVRYGLGRGLRQALRDLCDDKLSRYLDDWRDDLRKHLRDDPYGYIGRKWSTLATSVPATFPDVAVARLLIAPSLLDPSAYEVALQPRPINLERLGQLCELHFSWGNHAEILKTFRTSLWLDEVVRMFISEGIHREGSASTIDVPRQLLDITVQKVSDPPASGYAMARLRITDSGFSDVVTAGLKHLRSYRKSTSKCEDDCLHTAAEPLSVQVPAVIVERARPWLLTPSYETTGYNYGRVHLVRDMRDGVLGSSSLLHATLSKRRDTTPPSTITTPVKRMRLFRVDSTGASASSSSSPTSVSEASSKSPSMTRTGAATLATSIPLCRSATSTAHTSTASSSRPFVTATSPTSASSPTSRFLTTGCEPVLPRSLSPVLQPSDIIDLTIERSHPRQAHYLGVIDLTLEPEPKPVTCASSAVIDLTDQ